MRHYFLTAACCLAVLPAFLGLSSRAAALGLSEIIDLAGKRDAQVRADTLVAEARDAEAWQSVAGYGPSLTASGSTMRSRDSLKPEASAGLDERLAKFNEMALAIGFEQPLIDLEKGSKALQGLAEMDIALLLEKKAKEDLLLKVHERYYGVLSARESFKLARAETAALQKQVQNAVQKLELGFATITSQYEAEARYRTASATEIARKSDLSNALKALEELIDQEIVEELDDLDPQMTLPAIPNDLAAWLRVAAAANTDLKLKQLQVETARFEFRAAQSRFLPSLVFFADYSERHPTDGLAGYGEERNEMDVGLRLEGKLLAGGRDSAAFIAADKKVRAAEERTTVADRAMRRSVRSLWESIANTRQLASAYQQAVAVSEKALESTQAAYDEGAKVLLDVLNAEQDHYRSMRQYRTSRYDYMILLEKFRQVVGVDSIWLQSSVKNGEEI
ncbi:MAG: TolC family protein [Desulforhopalus sp.]|nr:TolC family protein [Desulforhopalus sp.]